ncbi:MAG: MFS transporter [Thermoplasmata archaeon]
MKNKKILILVIMPLFLLFLSNSIYMPNAGLIESDLGDIPGFISLTITGYLVGQAVLQFFYGPLSDRYGRYKVFIPALFGFVVANILCYFAWSGTSLIIFRFLQGATISSGYILGAIILSDVVPRSVIGRYMGIFWAVPLLAPPIGSFIGGFLGEYFSWRHTFLFLAILGFISFVLIALYLPETLDRTNTEPRKVLSGLSMFKRLDFSAVAFLGLALLGTYFSFNLFFSLILDQTYSFTPFNVGLFLTFYGMVDSFSVFMGGKISDRFTPRRILLVSTSIAGLGSLMFALLIGASPYFLLISFMVFGVGIGLGTAPLVTYILDLSPKSRGTALGMTNFVRLLGAAVVPFGGQFVREVFSDSVLFYISAILIFATVVLAWMVTKDIEDVVYS